MKLSLRAKIYMLIAALLAVLIVLLNFVPLTSSRNAIFEEKKSALSSQGNAAATALSRLDALTPVSVNDVFTYLDLSGYTSFGVTDGLGNTIFVTPEGDNPAEMRDIATALGGKTVFRSNFRDGAFDSVYVTPVTTENGAGGTFSIYERDEESAALILSLQKKLLTVTGIVCGVTVLATLLFTRRLLKRFGQLSDSMKTVAEGDYSHRLKVRGKDELSDLGNEFNSLAGKLQDTEQQRRRFVSDASHELKTPLASIRLLTDSIVQNDNMDSETMREFVTDIDDAADRLQRTTEKLLDLSRLDDDIRVASEPVDLEPVIHDAFAFAKPLADERDITIRCRLKPGCIVMATVDDCFHIVFNLIENAVKYNVPGGKVNVSLSSTDDKVTIRVSDTGIGIPEEDRLNVFTRFYRVDKARSREAGGSGLGLSIVHDAVKLHGGTITIGPNKPQGTVFTVTFPRPSEEEIGI